jgi:DNA modification methylase
MSIQFLDGKVVLHPGDCLDVLRAMPDASIDSVVTDPPYALVSIVKRFGGKNAAPAKEGVYGRSARGFMGKAWDTGERAFAVEFWAEVLRVLKPGGHVLAFSGTRTYHRLACAVEDAGFEIRDQIGWLYGSGFPKSHDVSKGIDKAAGAEREIISKGRAVKRMIPGADQNKAGWEKTNGRVYEPTETAPASDEAARWQGWGTALKPAWEPIVVARKPLDGTVAANVIAHSTGALNIDGCRVENPEYDPAKIQRQQSNRQTWEGGAASGFSADHAQATYNASGRWPANVIHDGSEEVLQAFPETGPSKAAAGVVRFGRSGGIMGDVGAVRDGRPEGHDDNGGSAARFFYTAKADADDRIGSKHPTVKPVSLMRYLVRLVTPPGGVVLDPFAGTGTTGQAAFLEGFRAVLIEREAEYQADIARRMELVLAGPDERSHAIVKAKGMLDSDAGPLFGGSDASGGGGDWSTAPSLGTHDRPHRNEEVA